ncbi:MAG: metal ABC transporter ATP-binding protein [Planctomycetaceae bacterium]|nr:metal ABC transporter ATP-binding protein [Planctomycetaceae bacterium]
MTAAIRTSQLTVAYASKPVLWDVNLEIPDRTITGILGPNGAGKTTLFKAILGVVKPLEGHVTVSAKHAARRDSIAYVPQRATIDWDFPTTVFDLVLMGTYGRLKWFQRPGSAERDLTAEALERVGMQQYGGRQINELSGGQQQRVFLARAFVQQASVYLMDEPFAGIDVSTERAIFDILTEQREVGKTIVMVHHDLSTVPTYFDHVVLLNRQLVASGPTASTFTSENVQSAFGDAVRMLGGQSS